MPTLADIYSLIDSAKRRAADTVQNPGASLSQFVESRLDPIRNLGVMSKESAEETARTGQLFGPKMRQLGEQYAAAYNPTGMTIAKNAQIPVVQNYEYRGSHKAPGPDYGAPLFDLTGGGQMYPSDVYSASGARIYGTGYPYADKEAFNLAKRVRGNPNAEVIMYRAVPKDEKITEINPGDWVTLSKSYAKTHGESALQGKYKIIEKKVKAKELWTNADSIHEFGYHPAND